MTDPEGNSTPSEKAREQVTALYTAYRQAGWALSTTTIGFATVLLSWGLPPADGAGATWTWAIQAGLAVLAIVLAFLQQFHYYQGSMKLARSVVGQDTVAQSNGAFSKADRFADLSLRLLIGTLLASAALWATRYQEAATARQIALHLATVPKPSATPDAWQRMQDCSAQVERVVKRATTSDGPPSAMHRQSHYSAKYHQCFMWESFINRDAAKYRDLPLIYEELSDAFEGKLLAICTDSKASNASTFCTVQEEKHLGDCGYCRSFLDDRLNN